MFDELSELSHDELQFVIDGFFLSADKLWSREELVLEAGKLGWELVGELVFHIVSIFPE